MKLAALLLVVAAFGAIACSFEDDETQGPSTNSPPVAASQSVRVTLNTAKSFALTGSDPDGDALTFAVTRPPAHGELSGEPPSLTYTPEPDYVGSDALAFTVHDGTVASEPATVSINVAPWDPPLGIALPSFGIDERAPAYDETNPLHFYVDNSHPAATDTDNPHGSPAEPRETLPEDLSAGSLVLVAGGTYTYANGGDKIIVNGYGTAAEPIFIRGPSAAERPVFQTKILPAGQYLIFEHLLLDDVGFDIRNMSESVDYVTVRSCELPGHGEVGSGSGIGIVGSETDSTEHIVVYNNHIHHHGDHLAAEENDSCGVAVGSHVHNVWVVDNDIHHHGGDSVIVAHNAGFSTDHIYIGRNRLHEDRENAVDIKEANDVIISQNEMFGYRPVSSSSGNPVVIHYGPQRIWVVFNHMYDAALGPTVTGGDEIYFLGNVIHAIHHAPGDEFDPDSVYGGGVAIHARGSDDVYAIHNTIFGCDKGITSAPNGAFHVIDNIISHLAEAGSYHVLFESSTTAQASDMQYNLLFEPAGPARIGWGSPTPHDVASFQSSFADKGEGCLEADPRFVAPPADLHVTPDSPAVDSGIEPAAYQTFFDLYGIDIRSDLEATSRPQGARMDIGAYER